MASNAEQQALLLDLRSGDRERAYGAAETLGRAVKGEEDFSVSWDDVFAWTLEADRSSPGVADRFWGEVQFDCPVYEQASRWMLDVLRQRGPLEVLNLPCNDLEFHVHEAWDHDAAVLRELWKLGFHSSVGAALDHGALPADDDRLLREEIAALGQDENDLFGEAILGLFLRHGIIHTKGIASGLIRELHFSTDKLAVITDYRKAMGRMPYVFIYPSKGQSFSVEDFHAALDVVLPLAERGIDETRRQFSGHSRLHFIPDFPEAEAVTRFFAGGCAATIFGLDRMHSPFMRIDFPLE